MGLKGGRSIVVRDTSFQWKAAHPSVRYIGSTPRYMDIIVHTVDGHGRLRAHIESSVWDQAKASDYEAGLESHKAMVGPGDVRLIIEKALDDGWEPVAHGQWELAGPLQLREFQVRVPG